MGTEDGDAAKLAIVEIRGNPWLHVMEEEPENRRGWPVA